MGKKINGLNDLIGGSDEKSIEKEIQKENKNTEERKVPKCFKMKPSLHKRIKVEAAQRGIDISDLMEEITLNYFKENKM